MNKVVKIVLLVLVLISNPLLKAQEAGNTVIVSGFVLNATTQEGVTANITIKNAETFRVVTVIPSSNLSGSYTFKLVRGRYYFVVETPGFELFSVLVDLSGVNEKRIQRNLILLPVGAKKTGYVPIQDVSGNEATFSSQPEEKDDSKDPETEMGWDDSNPEERVSPEVPAATTDETEESSQKTDEDGIEVEIVKPGERRVENGRVVYTGVPVGNSGKIIKEVAEEVVNSKGTSNIKNVTEERESEINFTIKGGAQFIDVPMYFSTNDANTSNVTEQMRLVLTFLRKNPEISLEIRGYSEKGFENAMQKQIALQRSVNVKKFMLDNGVSMERVKAIAYPTSDYELIVERKRKYRKEHLVEFRIKGDAIFEKEFKARFAEDYAQFKEGEVEAYSSTTSASSSENGTNASDGNSADGASNTNSIDAVNGSNQAIGTNGNSSVAPTSFASNDYTASSTNNSSGSTSGNVSGNNSGTDAYGNPIVVNSNGGTVDANGNPVNNGSTSNSNPSSGANTSDGPVGSDARKDINGAGIGSEGANYQIGYEGYDPNQDTVVTQDVFDALDKINASAARIDGMVIKFDPKLAEVDEHKYKNVIDSIQIFLMNNRRWSLEIYGYASRKGDKKEADVLHKNRAQNVYHILIDKNIGKTRLKFKGKGNYPDKKENGEKYMIEDQMIVTFKLIKPNLSGFNDNIKVDRTAKRGTSASGRNVGSNSNSSGAKTNYDESNGYDDLRTSEKPAMPEFKTEMEYINWLKENQGAKSVPGLYFRVQVGAFNLQLDSKNKLFKIKNVELLEGKDGMYRYVTEKYTGINDAYEALKKIKRKVDDAFVLAFFKNNKISMKEATEMLIK